MDAERNGMSSMKMEGVAPGREERSDDRPRVTVAAATPARDPEVRAKATRRHFTAAYKLSIVEEAGACETPGEIGELLRREGLYSSHLSAWRKVAREGSLQGLAKKRGPRPPVGKREAKKVRKLEREVAGLAEELRKARIIIDVQGKVAGLLGMSPGGRQALLSAAEDLAGHVGVRAACKALGVARATFYRRRRPKTGQR